MLYCSMMSMWSNVAMQCWFLERAAAIKDESGRVIKWYGARQKENIKIIHDAGTHLLNMVNNLLNLATLESGKIALNKELVDAKSMLKDLAKAYALLVGQRNIRWLSDIRSTKKIFLDRHRIADVLNNLVSNAIKYTPAGGTIMLGAREDAAELTIFVKDTGDGIEKSNIERIFSPFERGASPGVYQEKQSVGLGLAICRQLVHLHAGKIWVESVKGEGSCFMFTLPFMNLPS